MARIILPKRPDPARIMSNRIAAGRVQVASATAAVEEQVATVAAGVPPDLAAELENINTRLDALEPPAEP